MKTLNILIPMHLAGQGEINQRGYAMAALIVGLAVMAVLMTAAMPVWKHAAQREKEEELVFRGEQIAHAIGMFQRKTANAYPPSLDLLVQQKFLRKKYKDPITDDDFVPLSQAQQAGQQATQPGQQSAPGQQGRGQQQPAQAGAPGAAAAPGQAAGVAGGIIGVTSKSTDESIRLYKGRSHYNEWAFIYTPPAQAPGGGAAGTPGGPGRQGQPGPNGRGFPGRNGRGPGGQGGPFGPGRGGQPNFPQIPGGGRGR
jgi:type II secretory pathway pseudopilin PulG